MKTKSRNKNCFSILMCNYLFSQILKGYKMKYLGFLIFLLFSCEETNWSSDSDRPAYMCVNVSGNYIQTSCKDTQSSCSSIDYEYLGEYDDVDDCLSDTEVVVENWKTDGIVRVGPNADNSNSSGSGESGGSSSEETVDFTYSCPSGTSSTVPIPKNDGCRSEWEYFGKSFGCNEYTKFYKACNDLYGCLGASTDQCDAYDY